MAAAQWLLAALALIAAGNALAWTSFAPLGTPTEWTKSTQGYKLALRRWLVPGGATPRALVLLQHGGGFHSGYFGVLATSLVSSGFEVLAVDAIGHGYSEGPGGLTFFDKISHLSDDLRKIISDEKQKRPSIPIVLLGQSVGGIYAAPLAIEQNPELAGLILSGAAIALDRKTKPPALLIFIVKIVGRFFPKKTISPPELDATFDTAFGDPRWAKEARADPRISVGTFYMGPMSQIFNTQKRVQAGASKVECPLLVLHSSIDTRTDFAAAKKFFDEASSKDKKMVVYDDAAHQLYQDSEEKTKKHIADVREWLDHLFPEPSPEPSPEPEAGPSAHDGDSEGQAPGGGGEAPSEQGEHEL